ncbi:hypothetical protein KIN20_021937 [Parelaphostrongylus tenuis]|uniref:Uncharacterized protein n=1 Tax=Parelaphostrongylus tenuis TaxID=148309 RepID=A0AAD5MUU5_PARTN|nr:hypothetical protein KIN20_021937 [Parelaphostrongylus tenuis]
MAIYWIIQSFSARFTTLVDNKKQLDDTIKFSLLKFCWHGEALSSIQGFAITPGNYLGPKEISKISCNDKVFFKHLVCTKLAQLPACDPQVRQLPIIYNQMFALVRQLLQTTGADDSRKIAHGELLYQLPPRIRGIIYDKASQSRNVTPTKSLDLLTDIIRKETIMDVMESAFKSALVETCVYDYSAVPNSFFEIRHARKARLPFLSREISSSSTTSLFVLFRHVKCRHQSIPPP